MSFLDTLFSFRGRVGRGGWWLTGLIQTVLIAVLIGVLMVAAPAEDRDAIPGAAVAIFCLGGLVVAWIGLAATVKRWHDRDKSALWILIGMIPVIGPIWSMIELGLLPGTAGDNRFGPPPGSGTSADDWSGTGGDFDPDAVVSAWKASSAAAVPAAPRAGDPWAARPPVIARAAPAGGGFGRRGVK